MGDPVTITGPTADQVASINATNTASAVGFDLGAWMQNVTAALNLIVEALGNLSGEGYPT